MSSTPPPGRKGKGMLTKLRYFSLPVGGSSATSPSTDINIVVYNAYSEQICKLAVKSDTKGSELAARVHAEKAWSTTELDYWFRGEVLYSSGKGLHGEVDRKLYEVGVVEASKIEIALPILKPRASLPPEPATEMQIPEETGSR